MRVIFSFFWLPIWIYNSKSETINTISSRDLGQLERVRKSTTCQVSGNFQIHIIICATTKKRLPIPYQTGNQGGTLTSTGAEFVPVVYVTVIFQHWYCINSILQLMRPVQKNVHDYYSDNITNSLIVIFEEKNSYTWYI